MAFSAHKTKDALEERCESPDDLVGKIKELASIVKECKENGGYFGVFTGAGISTSAGIPDFRGPEGVWTLEAEGRKRSLPTTRPIQAFPTVSHMSLVGLQEKGVLDYLISQNCDGLHRRSGIDPDKISELHGNSNIEECEDCGLQYFRDFPCHRIGHRTRDHFTGRFCSLCNGRLLEYTIDFGQSLPTLPLSKAASFSKKAHFMLVLGSSLTVSPACDMPRYTATWTGDQKPSKGKLCIVNLQKTPLDSLATVRIFAPTDVVMEGLMKELQIPIPGFQIRRKMEITETLSAGRLNLCIKAIDPWEELPATIFKSVHMQTTNDDSMEIDSFQPKVHGDEEQQGFYVEPKTDCPHLSMNVAAQYSLGTSESVQLPSLNSPCKDCGNVGENWICLRCGEGFYCSRYVNEHMLAHSETSENHQIALSFSDLSFWCFACNSYVTSDTLSFLYEHFQKAKFEKPDKKDRGGIQKSTIQGMEEFQFSLTNDGAVLFTLHFMGHYQEPPLEIPYKPQWNNGHTSRFCLTFDPFKQEWQWSEENI